MIAKNGTMQITRKNFKRVGIFDNLLRSSMKSSFLITFSCFFKCIQIRSVYKNTGQKTAGWWPIAGSVDPNPKLTEPYIQTQPRCDLHPRIDPGLKLVSSLEKETDVEDVQIYAG